MGAMVMRIRMHVRSICFMFFMIVANTLSSSFFSSAASDVYKRRARNGISPFFFFLKTSAGLKTKLVDHCEDGTADRPSLR